MPDCIKYKNIITDYISGQIDTQMLSDFEQHIKQCPACRQELHSMQTMWQNLTDIPEQNPASHVRDRFYAMLQEEKKKVPLKSKFPGIDEIISQVGKLWPRRPAMQFAVAVIMMLLGLYIGNQTADRSWKNSTLATLQQQLNDMQQVNSMLLMQQPASYERLTGIEYSTRVTRPDNDLLNSLFTTLNTDANVNVRLAAVDALFLFSSQAGVKEKLVNSLAEQNSPLVQIALVDLLVQLKEKQALEALKSFIQNNNIDPEVKYYASEKVKTLL